MKIRFVAALLALALPLVARTEDKKEAENPYKNSKVGDYAEYKMVTKIGPLNLEGTIKQTVTKKDDKEAVVKVETNINGMATPPQEQTIDLTKPFDPTKAASVIPGAKGAKLEKLKDGKEKIKVGGKDYDCTWETYKVTANVAGQMIESELKLWQSKDAKAPLVKMEMTADFMGNKVEMLMELDKTGEK